jgi:hypothetical protein
VVKILFLDVDGVLNSAEWMQTLKEGEEANRIYGSGDQWWIDMINPAGVELLNEIVERTGAKVVISSTWRLRHAPADMQRLLEARGFTGEVIDRTPHSGETKVQREDGTWFGPKMSLHPQRGDEIKYWLHLHPEVTEFAVLDDDSDMDAVRDRFVKTYWQHWEKYPEGPLGLSREAADRVIALLGEG